MKRNQFLTTQGKKEFFHTGSSDRHRQIVKPTKTQTDKSGEDRVTDR